MNDTYYMA